MRRGPRPAPVTLTEDERQALTSLAHRSRTAPQLARRARIILACADGQPTRGIAKRLHLSSTTVCKWRTRFLADRLDGLTDEPRPGAPRRHAGRGCGGAHPGIDPAWRHPLEHAGHGQGYRPEPRDHRSDLACLRVAAAPDRDVQAVAGPLVDRQGARHRRAVRQSARARGRVLRRREAADSGHRAHRAATADATRPSRAAHLRLSPPRYDLVVRRARRQDRHGHRRVAPPPPVGRVREVPQAHRCRDAGRTGHPPHPGQLQHAQSPGFGAGWSDTRASICISRRPTVPG